MCVLCLQTLLGRDNLLSTLARLLRDDGLKSLELATAIAGCFYACSCLKQLHRLLLDNQVRGTADMSCCCSSKRSAVHTHTTPYMLAASQVVHAPSCMLPHRLLPPAVHEVHEPQLSSTQLVASCSQNSMQQQHQHCCLPLSVGPDSMCCV
jgi:hypothetical protein